MKLVGAFQGEVAWAEVCGALSGESSAGTVELRVKPTRRTLRVQIGGGRSVIVKIWRRRPRSGLALVSSFVPTTAYREWKTPQLLLTRGLPTPKALGYCRFMGSDGSFGEAVILEDLGECSAPMSKLKLLLAERNEAEIADFESDIAAFTTRLVRAGFLDSDHGLMNFAILPSGELIRLDFEQCRYFGPYLYRFAQRPYGAMLGRIIGTYGFGVQPRVDLALRLARTLEERLQPPRAVLRHARRVVEELMAEQRRDRGIDFRIDLPW